MEKNLKNIEKRIKEVAKNYKLKGFEVTIHPQQSELPEFLKGFHPDIIARSKDESVVIEVKNKQTTSELERYKELANKISDRRNWRFEIVFTNPIESSLQSNYYNELSIEKIKRRINEVRQLIELSHYEAAFLLGWSAIEASIRMKLNNENTDVAHRPTLSIIKTIFSLGYVNQHDYRKLEQLNQYRNQIVHGFDTNITKRNLDEMLSVLNYLIGESKKAIMYEWLEALDLDYYEDIYALYCTVRDKQDMGAFTFEVEDTIIIKSSYIKEPLELKNDRERKDFLELMEQEYMDEMDPEGWYGFKRAMEKDD